MLLRESVESVEEEKRQVWGWSNLSRLRKENDKCSSSLQSLDFSLFSLSLSTIGGDARLAAIAAGIRLVAPGLGAQFTADHYELPAWSF